MNLNNLFPIQAELDKRILDEHNLHDKNLTLEKTIALSVEFAEFLQEARFWKFWSHDKEPRRKAVKWEDAYTKGDEVVVKKYSNPLLEEYVDGLHFILSLGNDFNLTDYEYNEPTQHDLRALILGITNMITRLPVDKNIKQVLDHYIKLGYLFEFAEEQVIEAYMEKNKVNHERQETNY